MSEAAGTVSSAGRQARRHYGRVLRWLRHPMRSVEAEARHLHEVEQAGESAETPLVAILGLLLFLLPLAALLMVLAFGAAWLFG